jgi:hypothetical protein
MNAPIRIIELERAIQATYADGHTATLSFDGKKCTCEERPAGMLCSHLTGAMEVYKAWKWRKVDGFDGYQGPRFLQSVGIDPAIFNPLPVNWLQLDADTTVVWQRLWRRQHGWLFQFRDGAVFALVDEHPDRMTRCSLCHSRECKHVREGLAAFHGEEEPLACAAQEG